MSRRTLVAVAGGATVLALTALVNFTGVADLPFYTKGEPREALVVWEMANEGGLVLPLRNGDEIPSKPPLFHWLAAAASLAFGRVSEAPTRLPSGVLALAMTGAVYAFAATIGRIRSGWLASMALLFSFEWLRAARTARVDMTFSTLFAGALLAFAVIDRFGATRMRRIVLYACLAGATLAKGPIGLLLPLLVILVYAALPRPGTLDARPVSSPASRLRHVLGDIGATAGLPAVVAIALAWYGAAWLGGGDAFVETHALRENLFRVLDADKFDSGHSHGFFYLFGQFALGAFPWSLCTPAIAWWLWRGRPLDDTHRFLVVWFLVVFGFFLLPASKRGVYLLPAYPAGALLFGLVLGPGPEGEGPRRLTAWAWIAGSVVLGVLGLAGVVAATGLPVEALVLPHLRAHEAVEVAASLAALRAHPWVTACVGAAVSVASLGAAASARGAHWLRASVPMAAALALGLGGLVAPVERAIAESRSLAEFLPRALREVGDASVAFGEGSFDYGAVFYADRRIPRDPLSRERAKYLLVFDDRLGDAPDDATVVLRSRGTGARGRSHLLLLRRPSP